MYVTSTSRAVLIKWLGSISVPGLISKRRIAGQTRDMKSRGEGAVRFRPDTHRGGGGGGGGCCRAEEGEEPYMKWWGGGGGDGVATPPPCIRPWCTVLPHNNVWH